MVESKDWAEAEQEEMRRIISNAKNKKNGQTNTVFLRRAGAKVENSMRKNNFKVLDYADIEFGTQEPSIEDQKEFSDFLAKRKWVKLSLLNN